MRGVGIILHEPGWFKLINYHIPKIFGSDKKPYNIAFKVDVSMRKYGVAKS